MSKLLKKFKLDKAIKIAAKNGLVIWGSCAGAILLGNCNDPKVDSLNLINVEIERNGYGRQLDSFETEIDFNKNKIPGIFIRAPKIKNLPFDTKKLATHKEEIIAAETGRIIVSTFHPELTDDLSFHQYFLDYCSSFGPFATKRGNASLKS